MGPRSSSSRGVGSELPGDEDTRHNPIQSEYQDPQQRGQSQLREQQQQEDRKLQQPQQQEQQHQKYSGVLPPGNLRHNPDHHFYHRVPHPARQAQIQRQYEQSRLKKEKEGQQREESEGESGIGLFPMIHGSPRPDTARPPRGFHFPQQYDTVEQGYWQPPGGYPEYNVPAPQLPPHPPPAPQGFYYGSGSEMAVHYPQQYYAPESQSEIESSMLWNNPEQYGGRIYSPRESLRSGTPKLCRTSALAQASLWGSSGEPRLPSKTFTEPASLIIQGELQEVENEWSTAETLAGRRLVKFTRSQRGRFVTLTFKVIEPEEYRRDEMVLSCIYRKEYEEYYVTSVDCISLLEYIVDQTFTVEEKNRIRRNLEVCKPRTVSKNRLETRDFFKMIMSFNAPKPRNIEKDVKVLPWASLDNALSQIVGKYSAIWT